MAQLQFKGKTFVQNHHLMVPYHQLVPVKGKSLTKKVSLHDNLIIHGDNLKALKALLPQYAGKVKCIYIDPPYNTGNEKWVYNDNVNSPMMQEWLGKVVDREDLTRHDKWLCMMMPRLKLLKEIMHDEGVIFVSIDDNEQHHLKSLMDEVFQGNFVGQFIWRKKEGGGQTDQYFVTEHEYILVYAKSSTFKWLDEIVPVDEEKYKREDAGGKFIVIKLAKWGTSARKEDRPKMHFPLTAPDGNRVLPRTPDGRQGRWRVGKARMDLLLENDLVLWEEKNGEWVAYEKIYYEVGAERKIKERSILFDMATTGDASKILTQIFGKKDVFENPKPFQMVQFFLEHTTDADSVVLDCFAGSGPLAHATMAMNVEDGGQRQFILIECENYADTITAERVRRVIKGVPKAKDESLRKGLDGSFSYFELGKPIELQSILDGKDMPSYAELARYVFYTATGEEFVEKAVDAKKHFIGESRNYQVFLLYEADVEKLKNMALTLELAEMLPKLKEGKRRLVFAPTKYLDQERLDQYRIDFAQLPFEIYELTR